MGISSNKYTLDQNDELNTDLICVFNKTKLILVASIVSNKYIERICIDNKYTGDKTALVRTILQQDISLARVKNLDRVKDVKIANYKELGFEILKEEEEYTFLILK